MYYVYIIFILGLSKQDQHCHVTNVPFIEVLFRSVLRNQIQIRIQSGQWIWIRIQEGKNDPQNRNKLRNVMFWSAGCSLLRAEGLSC